MSKQGMSMLAYAGPFMVFMIAGWWGLAEVVDNKRRLRGATQGLDLVEELDPVERMQRRYGIQHGTAGGAKRPAAPVLPSLEEELEAMKRKVDIYDFDYKPVPRPEEDEE
ncbi:hypothetical protein Agub_g1980 [Astrephomene gubernaculifera]|uniref:Uncharacterized protein n=1 Tax=Astrephomene gubernaculifera TaxID=47775 RepID=A0AAD3DHH0_9CHLO|nr:hypothetical protein Agub_g1980 [Astrephomene gubernaculifera]